MLEDIVHKFTNLLLEFTERIKQTKMVKIENRLEQ